MTEESRGNPFGPPAAQWDGRRVDLSKPTAHVLNVFDLGAAGSQELIVR